ncbi:MAG: DNA polymerase III subunit delta [Candidatus Nealsonbacteria bacterium]|nr:MAG: DNA polymerase III subunit delta [Candidatus Nealsonbacteria bacterium]
MLLFLYGKDTYRLQQKLKEIENQYKKIHKSGLNLEKFDANQISFKEFWDKLFQRSMFIKKKLFFLENIFSNQKFKEKFLKELPKIAKSQDIVVAFEKREVSKADELYLGLKKVSKSQEFKPLEKKELRVWMEREFQKYEAEITKEGMEKLIEFVGNNLWQLSNEIRKLSFFKRTAIATHLKIKVGKEDVERLVRPKIETDIFKTIDALAQKDIKKALCLIQNHLQKGDSPLYLLKMINFQFRNLLVARALREEGRGFDSFLKLNFVHPFAAKKSWQESQYFTLGRLKKIYQKIFLADLIIKTGKISPEEGLKGLVTQI